MRALYRPRAGRTLPRLGGVRWVAGSLDDAPALTALVRGVDAVVHCAGVVRGATRADFDIVNVDATARLAQAAARQPAAPRFLLISSLAARCPELSDYAASKRGGEAALERVGGDMRWAVLRPPAVYGAGDRELLPLFRCFAAGFAPMPALAEGRFSLIHVDDLAQAVVAWLASPGAVGRSYEVDDGTRNGYDWPAILAISSRVLRQGRPIRRVPIPMRLMRALARVNLFAARRLSYSPMLTPGKLRELTHPDWVCDSGDFERATGWAPQVGFEQGLARTMGRPCQPARPTSGHT